MKCPKCNKTLMRLRDGEYICSPDCKSVYSEKELQGILDAEMIEEDTEIWKETKFGGTK